MRQKQGGFTLIELVVVIVILGILAATAIPKFVDLRSDANEAAFQGVKGAAASAMAINYAGCAARNYSASAGVCTKVSNCTDAGSLMQGGLPAGYGVSAAALTPAGATASCTLSLTGVTITGGATFTGIGT